MEWLWNHWPKLQLQLHQNPRGRKKDDFQNLILLNSEAVLGIYQRLRAVETVCFEFFKMSNALVIPIAAKAAGKRIADQRKAHRDQGKTWKLEHPIHAVIWLAGCGQVEGHSLWC